MKLKTPITITITTAENAVATAIRSYSSFCRVEHPNYLKIISGALPGEVANQIESQLREQGIDFNTWIPPQPFRIAGRECEFNVDGTVTLSCGTVVSNEEIDAFLKRREEAKEPEWPKYWLFNLTNLVFRSKHASDGGQFFGSRQNVWHGTTDTPMAEHAAKFPSYKPITRAEAMAIVGAENIDK